MRDIICSICGTGMVWEPTGNPWYRDNIWCDTCVMKTFRKQREKVEKEEKGANNGKNGS
jgi:DNA-directed RNA polymerase subunit RPC12/RpoP